MWYTLTPLKKFFTLSRALGMGFYYFGSKKKNMKTHIVTFITGVIAGAVLGILVSDDDKKKVQKQVSRLRGDCDDAIQSGTEKVKKLAKEYLS